MRPEECPRLDGCSKVRMILDKDMEDFQFVGTLREVCGRCTCVKTVNDCMKDMPKHILEE